LDRVLSVILLVAASVGLHPRMIYPSRQPGKL
jgi:hypothetical protein